MDWRHSTLHAGEWSQLELSMQASLVERWLADGMLHDKARRLLEQCLQPRGQGIMQVHSMQADMSATMRQAHALLAGLAPMQAMPLAEQLQLEGQILSLLGQWLALPPTPVKRRQDRWRRAVDDAIDIIHSEYGTELSISRLAWRVGTNECYLKQGFRERTGMGIATYLAPAADKSGTGPAGGRQHECGRGGPLCGLPQPRALFAGVPGGAWLSAVDRAAAIVFPPARHDHLAHSRLRHRPAKMQTSRRQVMRRSPKYS